MCKKRTNNSRYRQNGLERLDARLNLSDNEIEVLCRTAMEEFRNPRQAHYLGNTSEVEAIGARLVELGYLTRDVGDWKYLVTDMFRQELMRRG